MSKALTAICFLLLVVKPSFAQAPAQMTAAEILSKVSSVYASCSSYSDEGKTSSVFGRQDVFRTPPFDERFTTAFVRPDAFRFEFDKGATQAHFRFIVWKAGDLERAYSSNQSVSATPLQEKQTS